VTARCEIRSLGSRHFFLLVLFAFLLFLAGQLIIRSMKRHSIFEGNAVFQLDDKSFAELDLSARDGSKLHLQDFHRVEVKNGARVWEVMAKDAKYYADDAITHVNDASVVIYRSGQSSIELSSKAARLYLDDKSRGVDRVHLEGETKVTINQSLHVESELATYDSKGSVVTVPGEALVSGDGFEIHGRGLAFDVVSEQISINSDVHSIFLPGAEAPVGAMQALEGRR